MLLIGNLCSVFIPWKVVMLSVQCLCQEIDMLLLAQRF